MDFAPQPAASPEQVRIITAAQDLFLERGIGPVTLADVALALRLPKEAIPRCFPAGSRRS